MRPAGKGGFGHPLGALAICHRAEGVAAGLGVRRQRFMGRKERGLGRDAGGVDEDLGSEGQRGRGSHPTAVLPLWEGSVGQCGGCDAWILMDICGY